MARSADQSFISSLLDTQGPSSKPLDAAAEYIRARFDRVFAIYALAMFPHAIVALMLTQAIANEHRSRFPLICLLLTLATVWRWVGLAWLQYDVQSQLHELRRPPFWRRVPSILLLRLYGNLAMGWGGFLILPGFYGLYVSSFAGPLLLENHEPLAVRLRKVNKWIMHSASRLAYALMMLTFAMLVLALGIFVLQMFLLGQIFPSVLGINASDAALTMSSWAWRLGLFYLIFLLFDMFWQVASVFLYYDSQSRRMATDLRARLMQQLEAQP